MRVSLLLAGLTASALFAGCSITSTDSTTDDDGGGSATAQSTPDRCGVDFANETNDRARDQFLASINGQWLQIVQFYTPTTDSQGQKLYSKPGFFLDTELKKFGFNEVFFKAMSTDGNDYENSSGVSDASEELTNLRISLPLTNKGNEGDRIVSTYNNSSGGCITQIVGLRDQGLFVSSRMRSYGVLQSVNDFLTTYANRGGFYQKLDTAKMSGGGAPSSTPIASSPDKCGYDFVEETGNEKLEVMASLSGNWLMDFPGFSKNAAGKFTKEGFAFDLDQYKIGPIEFVYLQPVNLIAAQTDFVSKSQPTMEAQKLRISRPLSNYKDNRLMSAYDSSSQMCWTASFKFLDQTTVWISTATQSVGPLQPVSAFFGSGVGGNTYKHLN